MIYVLSVGTANPRTRFTKAECLVAFEKSAWFARLDGRAHLIARTVLQRDNGIEARRLAVESLDEVFKIDPNTLSARFLAHAPLLAAQAGERAMLKAGLHAAQVDAVVVSTCTGYLCPGLSGHVVERLGLRPDVQAFDLVGQGCAAALPNLMLGDALLATGACEHVLSICVEVSSAAMYLDNDPGVLISACLFGDGAGAAVLSRQPGPSGRRIEWKDSTSLVESGERNALMFEQRDGMLRNILNVHEIAGSGPGHLVADAYFKAQATAPLSRHHALCDARALRLAYEAGVRASLSLDQPSMVFE